MKKKSKTVWIFSTLVILVACGIVCFPLIRGGFFITDDANWMIIRLTAFYQSLREGQFPVRFLGRLNNSYGYPVSNFVYPGFLYAGSLIHMLGIPFVESMKLLLACSVLGTSIFLYLWLLTHFTPFVSMVGVLSFLFAPYLAFDMYVRGSVGEIFALPWVALGLYSIDAKKPWLFAVSTALLIVSHNSLALLFMGVFVLYLLATGRFRHHVCPMALGIGMATFFWFPAVSELRFVAFDSIVMSNPVVYLLKGELLPLVGFAFVVSAVIALVRKNMSRQTIILLVLLFGSIFMTLPVSSSLWNIPLLGKLVQFPYRFLTIGLIAGPWLVSYAVSSVQSRYKTILIVFFVVLWTYSALTAFQAVRFTNEPEGYYTTNETTTTIHDEYMPRWVVRKPQVRASKRIEFFMGKGNLETKKITTQTIDVIVHAQEDSVLQINNIYYPGWGASLNDRQITIDYNNPEGVMRVAVPRGTHRLVVAFRETVSRFLADIVSFVAFILFLVFLKRSMASRRLR